MEGIFVETRLIASLRPTKIVRDTPQYFYKNTEGSFSRKHLAQSGHNRLGKLIFLITFAV